MTFASLVKGSGFCHVIHRHNLEFPLPVLCIEHVLQSGCLGDVSGGATSDVAGLSQLICHMARNVPIKTSDEYDRPRWITGGLPYKPGSIMDV